MSLTTSTRTSTILAALLSAFLLAPASVSAHGVVTEVRINGQPFRGPEPNQGFRAPGNSIVRQVLDTSPVQGANNPDLACGRSSTLANQIADVNAGDEVQFAWSAGWPHRVGPILTYMASCGDVPCDQFDASGARWFKIGQQGKKPDSGEWFQADIANGAPGRAQIPPNLAPGNYIIRHELIALHIGMTRGGAEFYPSCSQLRVHGGGNGRPAEHELVTFPGGYSDDHPGIFVPGIFEPGFQYNFPGPEISSLAGGGGAPAPAPAPVPAPVPEEKAPEAPPSDPVNNGSNNAPAPPPPQQEAPPAPSPAPETSPAPVPAPAPVPIRRCRKRPTAKERAARNAARDAAASPTPIAMEVVDVETNPPSLVKARRHHSRVMRRLAYSHSH
ncbi:glycosyl hydrolase family 61 [Coprinopsis cinerea okayama7|uniref:AA9 family lytic polysaccharide monooxygenase n=1 Tax=Coprinopsis cinerea (strain Okayama-7 / 130 / ATCC MYA-4618 / FGSC 9003) TaxID=240176 RepID=A8NLZ6_COPC7|nr:glycosyl hydrolase family 61 [Coprinopsis cinerea okayama7\|eukprot:XP_001834810.1 glycosyl hydrolase family 61 [Coprinopsis cinerea okayama7\